MAVDNISKFYEVFNKKYNDFATEGEFRDWLGKASREDVDKLYGLFNKKYNDFGSADEMISYLGWSDPSSVPTPTSGGGRRRGRQQTNPQAFADKGAAVRARAGSRGSAPTLVAPRESTRISTPTPTATATAAAEPETPETMSRGEAFSRKSAAVRARAQSYADSNYDPSVAREEYLQLANSVKSLMGAEQTPENKWSLAQAQARLFQNPITRAALGDDAPTPEMIDFDLNRAEAVYISEMLEQGVDRQTRRQLKARLKELNRNLLNNNYYQTDVAARIVDVDQELDNTLRQIAELRQRAAKEKSNFETTDDALLAYPEYNRLVLAANQLRNQKRKLEHIQDRNAASFWVNFMDVMADPNTYNFGLVNAATKLETGASFIDQDAPGARELLDAVAGSNAAEEEEGQFVEDKGRWGAIAANSIPFMVSIGLTGGFGGIAEGVSGAVGNAATRLGGNALANNILVRGTGALLGDLAAGFVSANTIGGAKTLSDFLDNYYGTLVKDENGNYQYVGGTGNVGKSAWKSEIGNILEYSSERAGDHLQHLLGRGLLGAEIRAVRNGTKAAISPWKEALAKGMDVTLKDFGFRGANTLDANLAMKAFTKFIDISNKVGIQGYPFEAAEEYIGLLGNILLGGEEGWMDFSKLGDRETHADIWGGMLYSIGLTQTFAVGAGVAGTAAAGLQKARTYKQLESALNEASEDALQVIDEQTWGYLKNKIDSSTNPELTKFISETMDAAGLDDTQKAAVLDYAKVTFIYRGFNAGTIMQARERLEGDDNLQSLNINAEVATASDQIADAYMLGYTTGEKTEDDEDRAELEAAVQRQKAHLSEVTGIQDITAEQANELLESETASDAVKDAALDYLMALSVEQGFADAERNRQTRIKAQMIREKENRMGGRFYYEDEMTGERFVEYGMIRGSDGNSINIYLTSDIPDGKGLLPYRSSDGQFGMVSRDEIYSLDENMNIVPGTRKQSLNEFTDENYQIYEQERRTAQAEEDRAAAEAEKAQMLGTMVGQTVYVNGDGSTGAYAPVRIERTTRNGQNVVISGDKEALKGIATAANLAFPGGTMLEIPAMSLAPMLATNDDSSITSDQPQAQPQNAGPTLDGRPISNVHLDEEAGEAYFTYADDPNGMMQVMDIDEFRQNVEQPQAPAPAEVPVQAEEPQAPVAEEAPVEEEPQSKIPIDPKTGQKIYDAPGVDPVDAYEDMYSTEGLTEADVDEWVIAQAEEAEKNRNPKIKKGQSLGDWGKAKAEANRIADFWQELREVAEDHIRGRQEEEAREKARQAEIEKYGVDTRSFDLTPQSAEEAVAEYLGNNEGLISLDDAKKETFGKSKSGRIPSELFRHVGNGGILTKKGGRSIADVANDIVGEYEGTLAMTQDQVRDLIIDYLTRYTKSEMREMIFNNRLDAALAEKEAGEAPEEQDNASPYQLSDEVDENGRQFVLTSNGDLAFGEIPADSGLTEAPILLSEGMITNPATNDGYGLVHIEARHGKQIREAGYDSVVDFIEEVAKNYQVIRQGKERDGQQTYMLQLTDKNNNTLIVELSGDGNYWNINTAGVFRTSYGAKNNIVYSRPASAKQPAETVEETQPGEQSGTQTGSSGDTTSTQEASSEDKGNNNSGENNIPAEEAVEEAPEGTEVPVEDLPEAEPAAESGAEVVEEKPTEPISSPENSVPSQEETPGVPATAADIKNVDEARAFFEKQYGKGKRADNSVRVWELTHKSPVTIMANGGLMSQMAMALESASGLSQEEAAELMTLGTQLAEDFINDGFVKFPQFFKNLVETFGDGIRPFTKSIYLGASANVSDEISDQMDDKKVVRAFDTSIDINDISDEQNDTNGVSELRETVSEPVSEPAGEQVPGGEGEVSNPEPGSDSGNDNSGNAGTAEGEGRVDGGREGVSSTGGRGAGGNDSEGAGRRRGGRPRSGGRSAGERGDNAADTEAGTDTAPGLEATEEAAAKAEEAAYQAEKEAIKDETDTYKLKARKTELKSAISAITEKINLDKAKMAGQLRAIIERLRDLFSNNAKKSEVLTQEKVPYQTISDPEGTHAFGSVVPSGSADAMRDAIKRLEAEEGKSVADFVRDELGYKSLEEMFSGELKNEGLSSEQVDSVGLAIHQMKKGKMFIVGDMTGVGKGRQGAALIRWAKLHGKKVLFVTEKPDLFSDMYGDLADIGTKNLLPFIVNSDGRSNITTKSGEVLVRHPGKAEADAVYKSETDELPTVKKGPHKGKKYDFVMMTYSQAQSARTASAERKLDWVKKYAKDAIVICDESHNASGDSARGNYFRDIVAGAQGVTFMSATFAKRPDNMVLYALRSSMADAQMTTEDMIKAIQEYGIPMQEILASSLFKTGEMVRRERDFTDVKTHWQEPKDTYTPEEIKQSRATFDRSMGVVNSIIGFQRMVVDSMIKKMNEAFEESNKLAEAAIAMGGKGTIKEYVTTPYSSQVSNVANLMFYSIKAQKAADMAIEQIKKGEKPVIAVENTLESYLKDIEGDVPTADFTFILNRGLARSLNYRFKATTKQFNKETGKVEVIEEESREDNMGSIEPKMGPEAISMLSDLREEIGQYGSDPDVMPLMLSPIDYIKKRIEAAGYKCGEITGRSLQLVQAPDGTYHTEPFKADKKKAIRDFNGGEASNPMPKDQTTDAIILNTAGSTGISLHASRRFGDQRKRTMIILQPARDPNTEVQVRGRVDRTGQVSRAEYFYITSPIPAERKVIMMLKQKLASLDANAVGTEKVSSNRVDVDDMDNKYGDEVARVFLAEHPEINEQLDDSKQVYQKRGDWVGHEGLLYDLLIGIQRMSCSDQEMILEELQNSYKVQIDYLNQNGINDLVTTTMNLEAVAIDSGLFIKGKDNESMSEFAHDTNIERDEVNVINKPLRSSDIYSRMSKLGALKEDGTIDDEYGTKVATSARTFAEQAKVDRAEKHRAAEAELEFDLRKRYPKTENQTEEEYTASINMIPQLAALKKKNADDEDRFNADMDRQVRAVITAARYFKPGMPMFVPLTDDLGTDGSAPLSYGRFIGFKMPKDGKPKSIKAVFAVKDSRASIEIPVVTKSDVVDNIVQNTYGSLGFGDSSLRDIGGPARDYSITDEMRRQARDEWWDKMIPKDTNRQIRYMVTGNILQACGSLGKYKGSIVTFTRKDPDTGEITVERGMLLAEDFDPENFMVRSAVAKEDVWDGYDQIRDDERKISVQREGNYMVVKIDRKGREKLANHPIMKDDGFKELVVDNEVQAYSKDQLRAYVAEANVEKALEYLYKNYGFTKGHLFVMPDSTERVDAIVYTDKPYNDVINEFEDKYNAASYNIDSKIKKAVQQYKMDVNNEELKQRIREMVQLRQAYLRKRYAKGESSRLAWDVIILDQRIEQAKDDKETRDEAYARREAIKEELAARGIHGRAMHFESGKNALDTIIKTFNDLNKNPYNAKMAKKVFDIAKRLKLDVVMNEKIHNNTGGQTAGDLVEYNWKYMNAEWITDQMKADTILHELIHTATAYAKRLVEWGSEHLLLQDSPEAYDAVMAIDALYNAIRRNPNFIHKQSDEWGDQYTDYGVSDWFELLSEAGSNEQFRDDLNKVKVAPKLISGLVSYTDVTDRPEYTGRTMTALEVVEEQLNNLLDAFSEHSYTEAWRGTGYGQRAYKTQEDNILSREYAEAVSAVNTAEFKATNATLDRMEEELGVPIHRVTRDQMPKGHKTDKGYYDIATGEMTICMDNVTDGRDAIATVLHETVAHHGLRQLFGDRFRDAMVRIYAALDADGRRWVNSYIARHPKADNVRAVEEYLAHIAERGDFKKSVWAKIGEIIGKIVDALFGTSGFRLTDNELNYILRASYEHLKNPNWLDTVEGRAFDTLLKRRLGINESDPRRPTDPQGPDMGRLYRDGDTVEADDTYNSLVDTPASKMLTENQDADRPVRIGMDAVMKETGKTSLSEDEDYLTRHNIASSRAESQSHEFELFKFNPLLEQVRSIRDRIIEGKPTKDKREGAYQRILDYMYAVSGLERNVYKNAEIEQAKQDALADAVKAGVTDPVKLAAIEQKYEDMKKDWSGLTSLMGLDSSRWQQAEAEAQRMVDYFRAEVGDDAVLDELWNRVRACTDFSLEHAYKYGLLTRDEFEKLHGTDTQPRMWNYYLPLRGFEDTTAEEVYSYSNFVNPSRNSVVVKKMNGRWTKADNPLANILNIAETEIVQGLDNWAKQALYKFTLDAGENSLLSVAEPWYVKDPATGKWRMAEPYDNESLEDFEERMQQNRALEPENYKKGRKGLKLDNIMANKAHRNEHAIHLKVGGMDKMIWVNGNPALARAVSGIGRAQNLQLIRRASRALSNLFTTYSLDFTAKNLIRDTIYSRVALMVKEDRAYRHQFAKNWWNNFGYGAFAFPMVRLAAMWESGKLQQKPDPTKKEQMFMDFMRDGGQTGYTIINSVKQIKKDLERSMRHAGDKSHTFPIFGHYAKAVKTLNEAFELLTRFTAYETSRDMSRSGQRSAFDAKEISVNFNRRGAQSGQGVWGNIAAYLGATHYFYNAGVQGFDNFLKLYKKSPVKMTAATAGLVLMGVLTPMINSMLAGLIGGGDGDDDWYWNLPEWVRRNNLILGTGKWYLAIPLPVEFRAPYGIGDIAGSAFCYEKYPNRDFGNVAGDMIATASNILPVNPIEGYKGNIGDALIRAVVPDAGMFFVDWATNRDYTGRPLWKENPFSKNVPKSQGVYASTPKGIVMACQKIAQLTDNGVDVPPGLVRDFLNNYLGGFFRVAEDASKIFTGLAGNDPERPFRWDNVPFFSGFTGHIDEDRSNSFASNALYEYKNVSEGTVASLNAVLMTDKVSAEIAYDEPETLYQMAEGSTLMTAKVKNILSSKDYQIGKMYREGMNNTYKMKQRKRDSEYGKKGEWYKSREVERYGVDALRQQWKDLRDQWVSMPKGDEKDAFSLQVQEAWHRYYDAQADLAEKLMDYEYNKK